MLAAIFQAINDYTIMIEASGAPTTSSQLINIGLVNITNANIFVSEIIKWNDKDAANKTWNTFKIHFSKAQISVKKYHPHKSLSNIGLRQQANDTYTADKTISHIVDHQAKETTRSNYIAAEQLSAQQIQDQL